MVSRDHLGEGRGIGAPSRGDKAPSTNGRPDSVKSPRTQVVAGASVQLGCRQVRSTGGRQALGPEEAEDHTHRSLGFIPRALGNHQTLYSEEGGVASVPAVGGEGTGEAPAEAGEAAGGGGVSRGRELLQRSRMVPQRRAGPAGLQGIQWEAEGRFVLTARALAWAPDKMVPS